MATVFTYEHSSIAILQNGWNEWAGQQGGYPPLPRQGGDNWKSWQWCNPASAECPGSEGVGWSPCYVTYGHNSFCRLGPSKRGEEKTAETHTIFVQ